MPGIWAWGTMPIIKIMGLGRAPGPRFCPQVARHGSVQIKSQPALDGTFLVPHARLSLGLGGAAQATERAATDKTLNPVNCACPRVSRAPISARSMSQSPVTGFKVLSVTAVLPAAPRPFCCWIFQFCLPPGPFLEKWAWCPMPKSREKRVGCF